MQLKKHIRLAVSIATMVFLVTAKASGQAPAFAGASWIGLSFPGDSANRSCPVFQKTFRISKNITAAKLYITAHGLYEATLNGNRIGDAYFTPGFTSYNKRLQYQVYEVTRQIKKGANRLRVTLNGGWYSGIFNEEMTGNNYGDDISLLCRLELTLADGSRQTIGSDGTWQCGHGPILYSDFYGGEVQDTRLKDGHWAGAIVLDFNKANLVPTTTAPVTQQEKFYPKRIFVTPQGDRVIDFGQNMAGFVKLRLHGKAGDTIKLYHAEMLDKAGNFYTGNLRDAKATDVYILNGKDQVLEPHFTYHGFRYVKVTGFSPTKTNCIAVAIHTNLKHTGTFSCSDPTLNQLQHNIEWSLNSNFVDIPTDCPQRSERLGWTGDAETFCRTAMFLRDAQTFYSKYLRDLAVDQGGNGAVPAFIPDVNAAGPKHGVAGWGDAAAIIPWTLYQVYGDRQILTDQYPSMKAWVDYIQIRSRDNLWRDNTYGDWYAMGPQTSKPYIDQCFYVYSLSLLVKTAQVLHRDSDAMQYSALLKTARQAFLETYILNGHPKGTDSQTAYVLALQFDLLPDSLKSKAARRLVALIHENHDHLATGFLGTPYLLPVLTANGYADVAYTLLNQTTCPSWLYPVKTGATTIWERWDAQKPDSTLQETSFNHYSYGAVGDWLYRRVAGIDAASPGYQEIVIHPQPGGGLTWVKASYTCWYGKIRSEWQVKGKTITYQITIPPHTTAQIELPGLPVKNVGPGHYQYIVKTNQIKNQ